MPTAAERRALLFLASVAVVGAAVRRGQNQAWVRELADAGVALATDTADGSGRDALDRQIDAVDSLSRATSATRTSQRYSQQRRKLQRKNALGDSSEGEKSEKFRTKPVSTDPLPPIPINSATAEELERLPRIGPALAQRIVAWRTAHGPFQSPADLESVRGIGPALAARIARTVTF